MALTQVINDGLAHSGLPAGTVLQVVKSAVRTSASDTTTTSMAEISSDYRVTITPKAADSIMVIDFTYGFSVDGTTKIGVQCKVGTNSDFSTGMDAVHSVSHDEVVRNETSSRLQFRGSLRSYYDAYSSTATLYFRHDFNRPAGSGTARIMDNQGAAFVTVTEIQQ
tara:strand:- start:407 stop:904 length:498 start_codon:yes stop_codon:yes gene_type:complete